LVFAIGLQQTRTDYPINVGFSPRTMVGEKCCREIAVFVMIGLPTGPSILYQNISFEQFTIIKKCQFVCVRLYVPTFRLGLRNSKKSSTLKDLHVTRWQQFVFFSPFLIQLCLHLLTST